MAIMFPPPPVADGTVFGRWTFNLAQNAWLPTNPGGVANLPITGGTLAGPGNLTVNGTTTLMGATTAGAVNATSATVTGATTLANVTTSGTLGVTGNATFAADVTATGDITCNHLTTTGTSLDIAGGAHIAGDVYLATGVGDTVLIGNDETAAPATGGDLHVFGDTEVEQDLKVDGDATVSGNVKFEGDFEVEGKATLGQVLKANFSEDPKVFADPTFPTAPNLAQPPIVGINWAPAVAGVDDEEATFYHTPGSTEPLVYPVAFEKSKFYQIISTLPVSNVGDEGLSFFAFILRKGPLMTDIVDQQTILQGARMGVTMITRPLDDGFTHLHVVPATGWEGSFALTRVVEHVGDQASYPISIEGVPVTVLQQDSGNTASVYHGGGGALATVTNNTAFGWRAMEMATTGNTNTAFGQNALRNNTTGTGNCAFGSAAMISAFAGNYNTALGRNALNGLASGSNNTAVGYQALMSVLHSGGNVAVGQGALYSNRVGSNNTAIGTGALYTNNRKTGLTAVGYQALYSNNGTTTEDGINNTAVGFEAMRQNTTGLQSTACGYQALRNCTVGQRNTAFGFQALQTATTSSYNTAFGYRTLTLTTTGHSNTAIGPGVLNNNVTGTGNTGVGYWVLNNCTASSNTAMGISAMAVSTTANNNVAMGYTALGALLTGAENTALGFAAGVKASDGTTDITNSAVGVYLGAYTRPSNNNPSNQIVIGYTALGFGNNTAQIGASTVTGVYWGDRTNANWSTTCDVRVKEEVEAADIAKCLETVRKLKVSRWAWKSDAADKHVLGWTADDVEKVFPKAVMRDDVDGMKDFKSTNMSIALPTLWGAMQAALAKIEELEKEVSKLNGHTRRR